MKQYAKALICLVALIFAQTLRAAETDRYSTVAQTVIDLINAGDYEAVQKLFNPEMSKALPPQKATQFFAGMTGQFGKIQKLDTPRRNGGWTIFPAHFERG